MNTSVDVVVIGSGIVGASCTYFLSEAGVRVCVVERDFPASGTSRACDGLILLWDKGSATELALGQASARLWSELAESRGLHFEYARNGSIMLAEDAAALAAASRAAHGLQAAGVQAEVLDNKALQALEPHLASDLAGGVLFPNDAQVDARRATAAFVDAARQKGAIVRRGAAVKAIRRSEGGRVQAVLAGDEEIACGSVVCAAGAWSNEIAGLVGLELPVRPRKGHILVTSRLPGFIVHPMLEGGYVATVQSAGGEIPQVALVAEPTASGTLLLGSSREFAGFDRQVSTALVHAIASRALRFLPALHRASIIRSYAGLRPWSPDHLPLIGPVQTVPGFLVATGHEGAGIGLAPITGRLITDWVAGRVRPDYASQLLPDRFVRERK